MGDENYAGEQCQTLLIERQKSLHREKKRCKDDGPPTDVDVVTALPHLLKPLNCSTAQSLGELAAESRFLLLKDRRNSSPYGSTNTLSSRDAPETACHTIRFQVVVWNIGKLDVVAGTVPMTFRVSMFWNDDVAPPSTADVMVDDAATVASTTSTSNLHHVWKMQGRQRAFQQELKDVLPTKAIDVPPLAILNVSTFQIIGAPDVDMLDDSSRLMRWTCMYRATVVQNNLRVDQFPHDEHDIQLRLAILSHRGANKAWDKRHWKLALATVEDTQHSTRIPHGLIVDQARLPGFAYNRQRGLDFSFCPLDHGIFHQPTTPTSGDESTSNNTTDYYLKVSLKVLRESGYYDKNIVPILALMNVVAISVLTFDDTEFFYRALITLNIAFVQMGMRMTTDNHLPNVEYEIKLQRILNEFFVVLMLLVLEAMSVYVLRTYYKVSGDFTKAIDWLTGIAAVLHNVRLTVLYYTSKRQAKRRLEQGWKPSLLQSSKQKRKSAKQR